MGRRRIGVVNLIGCVYMEPIDSPFDVADRIIEQMKADSINIIFVDFHAEATGEKGASVTVKKQNKETNMEIELTSANFEAEVLKSDKPVLVDFWAPWCGPCRMLGPIVAEVAKERAGTLKVCKVNVDEASDLAAKYGINSIPALFLFKDGKVAAQSVGFMQKPDLERFVSQ